MRWSHALLVALAFSAVGSFTQAEATTYTRVRGAYVLSPDPRDCLFPLCGGWFIRAVNHTQTTCLGGAVADECYVADVDWAAMGWTQADASAYLTATGNGPIAILGTQEPLGDPNFPGLALLTPRLALARFVP